MVDSVRRGARIATALAEVAAHLCDHCDCAYLNRDCENCRVRAALEVAVNSVLDAHNRLLVTLLVSEDGLRRASEHSARHGACVECGDLRVVIDELVQS